MRRRSSRPLAPIPYALASAILALALAACSPKGEALYARAEASLEKGDARAAVIDLKNLVKSEPQNAKARALLGLALLDSGNVTAAAIEIQKAKDLGAPAEVLLVSECRLMVAQSEFERAMANCDPAAAREAAAGQLHLVRGDALLGLNRAAEAKPEFEAALAAKPGSLAALLGLASATASLDGREAVDRVLEGASEDAKAQPHYWMAVGALRIDAGDLAGAEDAFRTALDKAGGEKGKRLEVLSAMGAITEVQLRQGKLEEARATADKLGKAAPDNLYVKQLRGQVAAASGDLEEARTLLEEVVSAQPDNYQGQMLLGIVNLQQGNLGQAEMHFSSVVAKHPDVMQAQRLLVETRMRLQTPEQTLASLKPSLDPATADPEMLTVAGQLALQSGEKEEALGYLSQAEAQVGPTTATSTQLEIAAGYMQAGELDRAIDILEALPESGANGYQREFMLMVALLRKGQKDEALAQAEALVQRSGDDPAVRSLVAAVYAAAGDPGEGRKQFEEALRLKPDDSGALLSLARLDMLEGRTAEAETAFRKVLASDPKNRMALMGLASVAASRKDAAEVEKWLREAADQNPDSVEAQLALVQFYAGQGELQKASAAVEVAARIAPQDAAVANARGLLQASSGELDAGIGSLQEAVRMAPAAFAYRLNLARAFVMKGDLAAASQVLEALLEQQPDFEPALSLAANISLRSGRVEKAAGYIERLHRLAPESPRTLRLEGDLAMAQGRNRDALDFYRQAGAKGKDSGLVLSEYQAAVRSGAPAPERALEEWVEARPEDSTAVAVLAESYAGKGNTRSAIEVYEKSLAAAPGNALTLNNLAVLYQQTNDPRALETARKAYEANPNAPAIQDTYGWILFEEGQADESAEVLAKAARGLPDLDEVQYHYASALALQGKLAEAREVMKGVQLERLPEPQRAEARELLKRLSK